MAHEQPCSRMCHYQLSIDFVKKIIRNLQYHKKKVHNTTTEFFLQTMTGTRVFLQLIELGLKSGFMISPRVSIEILVNTKFEEDEDGGIGKTHNLNFLTFVNLDHLLTARDQELQTLSFEGNKDIVTQIKTAVDAAQAYDEAVRLMCSAKARASFTVHAEGSRSTSSKLFAKAFATGNMLFRENIQVDHGYPKHIDPDHGRWREIRWERSGFKSRHVEAKRLRAQLNR
ncbi:hypothetical protein Tco_0591584 [Tanacetum coccineum]